METGRFRPDGLIVALMLAILATAGFNCVLIMAAIVSGLIDGLHLSAAAAGRISACDTYGMSVGAFAAVLLVRRVPWRPLCATLLCLLIALDLATTQIHAVAPLMVIRAVHGACGGLLIGISYGVFARSAIPERCFAMLCVVQGCLAGFGLMFLPRLVPVFGVPVLFVALAAGSALALVLLPLLPAFRVEVSTATARGPLRPTLVLALLAIFFFQAGNSAPGAYIIELGRSAGLDLQFVTTAVGIAGWAGMAGAALVIVVGARFGRTLPVAIATLAAALGTAAFHASAIPSVYAAANIATSITWYLGVSCILGLCATFDRTGRAAALGGLCSKLGYASGPFAASFLLGGGAVASYGAVINLGVVLLCVCAALAISAAVKADRARET